MAGLLIALRVAIGALTVLGLTGFVLVVIIGKGLREAYRSGAGAEDILADAVLVAVPALLLAILASVFTPWARRFLHGLAAAVVIAAVGLLADFSEHPGEIAIYLGYLALWGVYYVAAVWVRT